MFYDTIKLDEIFSQKRTTFANRQELLEEQRVKPWPMPATHVYEYHYEEPTPAQLRKNRYLMPVLVEGVRELTLAEIGAKSSDFETLTLPELRWLTDHHKVEAVPLPKDGKALDDLITLKIGLRNHLKKHTTEKPKPAVKAQTQTEDAPPTVIPTDIAAMNDGQMKTHAAKLECYEEFVSQTQGKSLAVKREFLAKKRVAREKNPAPEPQAAA